jgi:hypothetical protein
VASSQNSPAASQTAAPQNAVDEDEQPPLKEEGEKCQNGQMQLQMLIPPDRLVTPMPRPKKGKTMRDSLKRRRRREEEANRGGDELKVVNIVAVKKQQFQMDEEGEGKKEAFDEKGELLKEELQPPSPMAFTFYEHGGTLRVEDFCWDATKPPSSPSAAVGVAPVSKAIEDANAAMLMNMMMSTRSI